MSRLMALLRRVWRAIWPAPARPQARPPATRALVLTTHVRRMQRIAETEGVTPEELDDAVQLLAGRYPVTTADVLAVVEEHGLERAEDKIEAATRGEP